MNNEKIKDIVEKIFSFTSCQITSCDFSDEDGMFWCLIETPDSRFMIGKEGETLRSLNHIVQKMLDDGGEENENNFSRKVFIDINGYQKKKLESLKNIAHMMAERSRYFKSNIEIDPMPAYERRIIHLYLEDSKDIKTESEGYGPERRVVIKYVGEQ